MGRWYGNGIGACRRVGTCRRRGRVNKVILEACTTKAGHCGITTGKLVRLLLFHWSMKAPASFVIRKKKRKIHNKFYRMYNNQNVLFLMRKGKSAIIVELLFETDKKGINMFAISLHLQIAKDVTPCRDSINKKYYWIFEKNVLFSSCSNITGFLNV